MSKQFKKKKKRNTKIVQMFLQILEAETHLHLGWEGCWTAVPWISCWIRTSLGGLATVWINAIFTCRPKKYHSVRNIIDIFWPYTILSHVWLFRILFLSGYNQEILALKLKFLLHVQDTAHTFGFFRMCWDNAFCQSLEFHFPLFRQPNIHLFPRFILLKFGFFEVPLTMFPP